jgi:hypothetical protein
MRVVANGAFVLSLLLSSSALAMSPAVHEAKKLLEKTPVGGTATRRGMTATKRQLSNHMSGIVTTKTRSGKSIRYFQDGELVQTRVEHADGRITLRDRGTSVEIAAHETSRNLRSGKVTFTKKVGANGDLPRGKGTPGFLDSYE